MRSFEIAATGRCKVAKNTVEHRKSFGSEGEATVYFRNAKELLCSSAERRRLAGGSRPRTVGGAHSCVARLAAMPEIARQIRACERQTNFSAQVQAVTSC
jgi:hypothetical protein